MYYFTLSTQKVVMLLAKKCELLWTSLTFSGPRIVIYSYSKTKEMH